MSREVSVIRFQMEKDFGVVMLVTPGHKDFVKKMADGVGQVSCMLYLTSANYDQLGHENVKIGQNELGFSKTITITTKY
jgi:translation elongation factor EF-1alpha